MNLNILRLAILGLSIVGLEACAVSPLVSAKYGTITKNLNNQDAIDGESISVGLDFIFEDESGDGSSRILSASRFGISVIDEAAKNEVTGTGDYREYRAMYGMDVVELLMKTDDKNSNGYSYVGVGLLSSTFDYAGISENSFTGAVLGISSAKEIGDSRVIVSLSFDLFKMSHDGSESELELTGYKGDVAVSAMLGDKGNLGWRFGYQYKNIEPSGDSADYNFEEVTKGPYIAIQLGF